MTKPTTSGAGRYRAVVIGTSAGGINALSVLFSHLPDQFDIPIIFIQHLAPARDAHLFDHLCHGRQLTVKEADEKEPIRGGTAYYAPPGYHLLVESDETFALTVDEKVNHCRPSIDVLFESASYVWADQLVAILLTGANKDGAEGMRLIHERGGLTIAQDPATAESPVMPRAAIDAGAAGEVLSLDEIGRFLEALLTPGRRGSR